MKQYLEQHRIITDGSFGTYYAQKYNTLELPELANTEYPGRVKEIHKEYILAGANLIRTNTFAVNVEAMSGNQEKVEETIRQAVWLAREAVKEVCEEVGKSKQQVFIAGDIGPAEGQGREDYCDLVRIFLKEGISVFTFETFGALEDILPAVRMAKEAGATVLVTFSVNQFGYSNQGLSARKLVERAFDVEQIDGVGLNCGVGPGHMEKIMQSIEWQKGKFRIALPNAGYPKRQKGYLLFNNQPDYFAHTLQNMCEKYGLDIVGGCCGTTPVFIRTLAEIIEVNRKKEEQTACIKVLPHLQGKSKAFFLDEEGKVKKKKLIAVELAPPLNGEDDQLLAAAFQLKESVVDVITFPDSPSGRTRIDSVLMAAKVKRETNIAVMPHICCRDKNAIAMRSLFLGASINDIHNMLIITGDPIPSLERQSTKGVFNFDAVGLMNIARDMNEEGMTRTPISYGGAINQGRRNLEVEINRVRRKMDAGAEFFLTQPVFSKESVERIRQIKEETGARILCGIMPLVSRRNAEFMRNEIPGVSVPLEVVNRYPEKGTKEEGEAVGVAVAKEMIALAEDFADGYYFSFPFNRVHMLERILE
ncbi:MAG: bifunctional homocysteine S-methyltransferase/methylenetetrahydrofolate reductase [Lachnospiraceae bacterium]|nr:bifunctional homocysteine S-methyltransferase/methylenetetrahydrofolate reductase [Lachnospiraceae bacterium]